MGVDPGRATQEDSVRLGEAMKALGWRKAKMRLGDGNPRWCYAIGDGAQRIRVAGLPGGATVLVDGMPLRSS